MAAAVDRQCHLRRQPDQGHPAHGRHRPCENPAEAEEAGRADPIGGVAMNVLVVEPGFLPYEHEVDGLREMEALSRSAVTAVCSARSLCAAWGKKVLSPLPRSR